LLLSATVFVLEQLLRVAIAINKSRIEYFFIFSVLNDCFFETYKECKFK
jgi:hypothetical protein